MKTIWRLICKDFRRDARHPWTILLFACLPLLMTGLIAAVFGGGGGGGKSASMPVLHVAVLDQDRDLFARLLRALPAQGEAAQNLRLHFVETREAGLRMLEERQASALVVLPRQMTESLLSGRTNVMELYENPAEQVLPRVARQGVFVLAEGLSGAAGLLQEPLQEIRSLTRASAFPATMAVSATATNMVEKMSHVKGYLFPPLIQFQTIKAEDYHHE